jgi:hypothetical protein
VENLAIGFVGGVAAELVGVWEQRHTGPPAYVRSTFYWIAVILMSGLGAGLVWLYEDSGVKIAPFLALNIGASAPLILRQLTRATPDLGPGRTG